MFGSDVDDYIHARYFSSEAYINVLPRRRCSFAAGTRDVDVTCGLASTVRSCGLLGRWHASVDHACALGGIV